MYYVMSALIFLWTESDFYPGGGRGTIVDLEIQRDTVTGLPIVRASSIKGAIRSYIELKYGSDEAKKFFGSAEKSGRIIFSDGNILFFPVNEINNFFVYLTGYPVLENLSLLLNYAERKNPNTKDLMNILESIMRNRSSGTNRNYSSSDIDNSLLIFDGTEKIGCQYNEDLKKFVAWIKKWGSPKISNSLVPGYGYLLEHLVNKTILIHNDAHFRELVNRGLTRVVRIGIDYERKVVREGHLFTQELIPRYTVLYFGCFVAFKYKNIIDDFLCDLFPNKESIVLNFGGDESIGRGVIRMVLFET